MSMDKESSYIPVQVIRDGELSHYEWKGNSSKMLDDLTVGEYKLFAAYIRENNPVGFWEFVFHNLVEVRQQVISEAAPLSLSMGAPLPLDAFRREVSCVVCDCIETRWEEQQGISRGMVSTWQETNSYYKGECFSN